MPIDIPIVGARSAVWITGQLHLFFAAFILGAPIFVVICEWWGHRSRDERYERLAHETMKVVLLAYGFTAISGAAFGFALMGPYSDVMVHLFEKFGPLFGLYPLFFLIETVLAYLYCYTWGPLARRKGLHILIGVALNVVGTVVMLLMNAVGAYMLTPPASPESAGIWELVNNATWSGLNLHRFVANVTLGGFMVALFAAFMFLTAKTHDDRAFYDWMGFTGNFIGVATLMALPLAGYVYSKEIFLYDATIATFMMADKLSWFFVVQGLLVSLLFLGANYYMWVSIRRVTGAEPYRAYQRPTFTVILAASVVWMVPQNFLPDLVTTAPAGVAAQDIVIPERAAFLGLMMAKALAVTAIILLTFLTYMCYRRAIARGTMRWGEIAPQAQYALVFVPAVAVYTMGFMGAIRELARQDWHVYNVLRDTTPYWYTTPLGHTGVMAGIATLVFFTVMAFIFWIGFKLGQAA
ncbi:MAG: cytochrome ubiquinol oxidase subunit I [Chloroflexi bacterium]|nr:cytochrome ubiquinol oxidase subunit I [Chloroflexota bacterium]MBI4506020.1 cytochrome ubiquinol oxidase subunit I [Chloroflexota bacterium]